MERTFRRDRCSLPIQEQKDVLFQRKQILRVYRQFVCRKILSLNYMLLFYFELHLRYLTVCRWPIATSLFQVSEPAKSISKMWLGCDSDTLSLPSSLKYNLAVRLHLFHPLWISLVLTNNELVLNYMYQFFLVLF